ncbi:hypothetical protein EJB05_26099 [Eragrostis curvula]|uniref:Uncharacterized protein n=1 Tax=Eragrostis curvula TaxID=38414 RepID=A0A5J9UKM9_9POAL|nr:hypothetical protein EJB05_26099 [Eragrostis curvula]
MLPPRFVAKTEPSCAIAPAKLEQKGRSPLSLKRQATSRRLDFALAYRLLSYLYVHIQKSIVARSPNDDSPPEHRLTTARSCRRRLPCLIANSPSLALWPSVSTTQGPRLIAAADRLILVLALKITEPSTNNEELAMVVVEQ